MIQNVDVCCGLAWGDEAKGKIVSELLKKKKYDWVCRWSGGSNAGHTIYINGKKYTTHIIPAGVFFGIPCYIGPDCYLNLFDFDREITYLQENGIDTSQVYISSQVHIVTSQHKDEDLKKYQQQQGSTGKGIAPCAKSKFGREGVRLVDYNNPLKDKYQNNIFYPNSERCSPLQGTILCEGAQGFWLDINYGNYPYVTSSTTLPYSSCSLGFPPQKIRNIYGAAKIYDTRVGKDPDFDELPQTNILNKIAEVGNEFGSTTGRARKVYWLNMDKLIQAINISGTTHLIFSKIDVLQIVRCYRCIHLNKVHNFISLEGLLKEVSRIIKSNCYLIEKIIFSDNPETIEDLSTNNV